MYASDVAARSILSSVPIDIVNSSNSNSSSSRSSSSSNNNSRLYSGAPSGQYPRDIAPRLWAYKVCVKDRGERHSGGVERDRKPPKGLPMPENEPFRDDNVAAFEKDNVLMSSLYPTLMSNIAEGLDDETLPRLSSVQLSPLSLDSDDPNLLHKRHNLLSTICNAEIRNL
ncbi:hypothetical protein V1478_000634 [Vespula squamosa]|uniref:Uncharacterized protein n=1 Tax=Vespula squamosa TaxID=30214 RepID=A0ABD2C844_VESSQ